MKSRLVAIVHVVVSMILAIAAYELFAAAQPASDFIFRVSVASDGTQGNGDSFTQAISADGQVVAFISDASNLVDGSMYRNLYFHDRNTQLTTMLPQDVRFGTIQYGGEEQVALSGDGHIVALQMFGCPEGPYCPNTVTDVFVHDRQTGEIARVSAVSDTSDDIHEAGNPMLSSDGRIVAFGSDADNLVPGDVGRSADVFVRDMSSGEINRVSVATDGTPANAASRFPAISSDGRLVAFVSHATNLDSGDTDEKGDIYVHDRQTGETSLAWKHGQWGSSTVTMTGDGRYLAIAVVDPNYCDQLGCPVRRLYVADLETGQTLDALAGIRTEGTVAIAGGPIVTLTTAESLLPEDTNARYDVYRYDFAKDEMTLVSAAQTGQPGAEASYEAVISADGSTVAFGSRAPDLIIGDTNNASDVFLWSAEAHFVFLPALR